MSFGQFFNILWVRRGIIFFSTFLCLLGAMVVIAVVPKRFVATTSVILDIIKPDPVTGDVISSAWARTFVKTQTEIITDYRVAGKVVDALGWTTSPDWAAAYAQRPASDHSDFRRWLAENIIDGTDVKLTEGSNILEINFTSNSPERARTVANAIRQAYYDQTLAFKREGASRNALWFHQQVEKLREQLTKAENLKSAFEKQNGIILEDGTNDTDTTRLKALASSAAAPAVAAAGVATSPMATQLAQLDAQIASASQTLGPNHPEIQTLKQNRATLAAAAAKEVAAARSAMGGGAGPSVDSQLSAQTSKVLAKRDKVYEAQRLASDVMVLRDQLNKISTRAADLDRDAQSTETGLTLLGDAVAPDSPAFPKKGLVIGGALGAGLAFGVLLSLLLELIYRRVRTTDDLGLIGLTVLGVMPLDQAKAKKRGVMYWLGLTDLFKRKKVATAAG